MNNREIDNREIRRIQQSDECMNEVKIISYICEKIV